MAVDLSHDDGHTDYAQHARTYAAFVKFVKYGTLSVAIVLLLLASFLL